MRAQVLPALVMIGLVLALIESPALAQGNYGSYSADGVNIRTGPATSYTSIGLGYTTHTACVFYLIQGEVVDGNSWWVNHTDVTTGVGPGFSSFNYVFWGTSPC